MRIIVTSGGTGGHIYPAVSLVKYLQEKGNEVIFVGSKNKMEERICKKENIIFFGLNFANRKGIKGKIKFVISIIKQYFLMKKFIKHEKIDLVVGFGNYISFPVCLAARSMKVKIILHEQNSTMGKANIILGNMAYKIGYSIPLIKNHHRKKLVFVGNPRADECLKENKTSNINIDLNKNNILIFMGSLGSSTVNEVLIDFINDNNDNNIYHIVTGKEHYEKFMRHVSNKENIKIYPYIDNILDLMKKCDLVITRSGATTISEIITLGLPSILIPSPYVVKNHQFHNAKYLLENNACLLIEEKDLSKKILKDKINYLLNNKEVRINIRLNSLKLAIFNSNQKIYNLIKEAVNE